jgi:hypothetical protein
MISTEYERIISALTTAERVLASHQGELSPADIRIRSLINITTKETKRALFETSRVMPGELEQFRPEGDAMPTQVPAKAGG